MYFSPFAKKNKPKFDQDFKACWSFCYELKMLRTKIFETGIETLYETKYFKSITCIPLENDTSIAETFFQTKIFETEFDQEIKAMDCLKRVLQI